MQWKIPATGDRVEQSENAVIVHLEGKRRVVSTAAANGGCREDLTAVFNHDGTAGKTKPFELKHPDYAVHMKLLAEELGLDGRSSAGLCTAAQMKNTAVCTETFRELIVTAVVTGGIEVNGGRVGDPAAWYEVTGAFEEVPLGTINIMLFLNADLDGGALMRAFTTCTEAKTAAIQELLIASQYSMGLATGSGTDGTILVSDRESELQLTNAGQHSKLGELIGRTVRRAVKEALYLQTGVGAEQQHNAVRRLERFGIEQKELNAFAIDPLQVVRAGLFAHLMDELMWGMLEEGEVRQAIEEILCGAKNTGQKKRHRAEESSIRRLPDDYRVERSVIEELRNQYLDYMKDLFDETHKK